METGPILMRKNVRSSTLKANDWVNRNFVKILIALGLVVLVVVARLVPHLPDFTPTLAVGLVAGTYLPSGLALLAGLGGYFASNLFLPGNSFIGSLVVVAAIVVAITVGRFMSRVMRQRKISRKLGAVVFATLISSVAFFLITNCNFLYNGYAFYPMNFGGLIESYVAGIPFFRTQLLGDLVYSGVLFGAAETAKWLVLKHRTAAAFAKVK